MITSTITVHPEFDPVFSTHRNVQWRCDQLTLGTTGKVVGIISCHGSTAVRCTRGRCSGSLSVPDTGGTGTGSFDIGPADGCKGGSIKTFSIWESINLRISPGGETAGCGSSCSTSSVISLHSPVILGCESKRSGVGEAESGNVPDHSRRRIVSIAIDPISGRHTTGGGSGPGKGLDGIYINQQISRSCQCHGTGCFRCDFRAEHQVNIEADSLESCLDTDVVIVASQ